MNRVITFFFVCWALPLATVAAQEPRTSIEATVDSLLGILYGSARPKSVQAREKALRKAIEKRYSFDVVVQRALGANRRNVSTAELKQVISLTTDLMIRTYSKRFAASRRPEVSYGKAKDIGKGRVELVSTAKLDGAKYKIMYRMAKTPSGWQIYDLVIEGVSLVANYRKQFDQHFRKGQNAKQLITRLKRQINSAR